MTILKLIRLPNLIIIAIAQLLLRYTVVVPLLNVSGKIILLTHFDFILIVVSTLFLAIGGYVINDIEDRKTDNINKPQKVIVGSLISVNMAYRLYYAFTIIGLIIGCYLQFFNQINYIGYIQIVTAGLLYFYSTTYKGIMVLGNLIISLLTSMSLAIVIVTEPLAITDATTIIIGTGYFVFAFLLSFTREIIKDMEDMEGDIIGNYKTLPVVVGSNWSKALAIISVLLTLLLLVYIQFVSRQWNSLIPFLYVVISIQIPLVLLIYKIGKATIKRDFSRASLLAKGIMFCGILSMLIFYLTFK